MTSEITSDDSAAVADPVERLLESARDETKDGFRVTGVMMQYYFVCKRELWFLSRDIEIDRENPTVVRGTHVDETSYAGERRSFLIDGTVALDLLDDGQVVEVKPSSALVEPARMQLSYYLWYLDRIVGIEKSGVLVHPRERRRETVELTSEVAAKVEDAIRGIHDIVTADAPPPAKEKPFCGSCAYHDFCWCC